MLEPDNSPINFSADGKDNKGLTWTLGAPNHWPSKPREGCVH